MVTPQDIERINELARKKKTEGLTEAEKVEQAELRKLIFLALNQACATMSSQSRS